MILTIRIRAVFGGGSTRILCPPEPGSAVVMGAVLYGFNPEVISARRSRYTYGVQFCERFDPQNQHHLANMATHKKDIDGTAYCTQILSPFVKMNDAVEVDHTVSETFYPMLQTQTDLSFQIFHCESRDSYFVTDRGVKKLGKPVQVKIPVQAALEGKRSVKATMFFGLTEIRLLLQPEHDPTAIEEITLDFRHTGAE
ncbi:hypothetical protein KIPB_010378 [Kipferlia bialata]|uniref:Uncharacterized protein n=1 Tax=Kipferlia bialata TaxID=797122 RepID=A0A9K3GMH2_9EUKA|nr:hypothetical protein KIPB_010378 [Kipferlia bialata]|eukprot:g10378.t1